MDEFVFVELFDLVHDHVGSIIILQLISKQIELYQRVVSLIRERVSSLFPFFCSFEMSESSLDRQPMPMECEAIKELHGCFARLHGGESDFGHTR